MAASTEKRVYERAISVLAADAVLGQYNATPWLYELIPGGSRDVQGLAYGVGVLSSEPGHSLDKQRAGADLYYNVSVGVRILRRIRADNLGTDYASALAAPSLAVAALIDAADTLSDGGGPQSWHWLSSTFSVVAGGTHHLTDLRFRVRATASESL